MQKRIGYSLPLALLLMATSQVNGNLFANFLCPVAWSAHGESCWKMFNYTDYCGAMESCHFYGGHFSNKTSTLTSNSTSRLWIFDATSSHAAKNLSCRSSDGDNQVPYLCPFRSMNLNGSFGIKNCSLDEQYICESQYTVTELGLQDGRIKNHQLSSSSFYRSEREPIPYQPKFARLKYSYVPGAATQGGWCSKNISGDEFFQVDFGRVVLVTRIAIQGVRSRDCNFWVTLFNVSYESPFNRWFQYTDNGTNGFLGNEDAYNIVTVSLLKPRLAKKLRIHPISFGNNCPATEERFCLRLEAYGIELKLPSERQITVKQYHFTTGHPRRMATYASHNSLQQWPYGSYSLPRPKSGCPATKGAQWRYGYRLHDISIISSLNESWQSTVALRNSISPYYFVEEFCSMSSNKDRPNTIFPPGEYCVYMNGNKCPNGFQTGSLRFFENATNWNRTWTHTNDVSLKSLSNYNQSHANCCFTEFFYCCRNDSLSAPLQLPSAVPFYLLPMTTECPHVTNTKHTMEYVDFEIGERNYDLSKLAFGAHPYVLLVATNDSSNRTAMRYHICYYEPTVTNSTSIELVVKNDVGLINANYPVGISIVMLFNGSMIQFGNYSMLNYTVTFLANCIVSNTHSPFTGASGVGMYVGGVCPSQQCRFPLNATIAMQGILQSRMLANTTIKSTVVSKTNILLIIRNGTLFSSMANEIKSLQSQLSTASVGPRRQVSLLTCIYNSAYDIIKKLREFKERRKSDPDDIHGIVAINAPHVIETVNSYACLRNVPLLTGRTNADIDNVKNEATLQIAMITNSNLQMTFTKLRELNITNLTIIRAHNLRVPTSFAYYLLAFNLTVTKDIVLADGATPLEIVRQLNGLRQQDRHIYFMVNAETSAVLFIAAIQARVSPMDRYTWISGSKHGVLEHGIGSKECYDLRPVSCGVAFKGVMMFGGLDQADSLTSRFDGSVVRIDSVKLKDQRSAIQMELLKAMVLDGAESIVDSIKTLAFRNETIKTANIVSLILQTSLKRLIGLQFLAKRSPLLLSNGSCLSGWVGANCSHPICIDHHCYPRNGRCVAYETCECLPGHYGKDCSGDCKTKCKHGICNDGALGDGTCTKCEWLYEGIYCDQSTVLKALIASCLGSLMVTIIVTGFILKVCRPRQSSMNIGDNDESYWLIDWEVLTELERISNDKAMTAKHLAEKVRFTDYFKAKLRGECVFVTCMKKKPMKLSLDIRVEIRKVKQLDHINVEKVKAVCLGPPFVAIVTELASMGSLYDRLHSENVDIPLEIKYAFMEDICRGMIYLHDKCRMTHGRLKSTNCLLHKGWRVKITDVGLASLRKNVDTNGNASRKYGYYNQDPDQQKQNSVPADFNSLLWTAPEYLGPAIVNIDQIGKVSCQGDVYSFGILMAEILTRRPPYGEIKVMSIQHIIEAVAHLREPMVDLEVIRPGSPKARQDILSKQAKTLRPSVRVDDLPKEEPGKSILNILIESSWSDDPDVRPPFSHIKTVLRIIAPLKGDQIEKRAFLLEKETETLEKYIAYDMKMISKEEEKAEDWLGRSLPSEIYFKMKNGEEIEAMYLENVSAASFQIENIEEIIALSSPDELSSLLDYVFKTFCAIAANFGMEMTEVDMISNSFLIVSDGKSDKNHAESIVNYCLIVLQSLKNLEVIYNPDLSIKLRVAAHSGCGVAGMIFDSNDTSRYTVFGNLIDTTLKLSQMSKPNCLLITDKCAKFIRNNDKMMLVQRSNNYLESGVVLSTYWVVFLQ